MATADDKAFIIRALAAHAALMSPEFAEDMTLTDRGEFYAAWIADFIGCPEASQHSRASQRPPASTSPESALPPLQSSEGGR